MSASPYIHDLNPVIWQITDSIALRWYGVAYLLGFIAGYFLLSWLSRRKLYPVPQDRLADFVTYVAIFGVLLGGRLGYVLFTIYPITGGPIYWRIPSWSCACGRAAWPAMAA